MFERKFDNMPKKMNLSSLSKFEFVNRDHPIKVFTNYLLNKNIDSPKPLIFCGIGGHGKSALAEKLLELSSYNNSKEKKIGYSVYIDFNDSNIKIDPLNFLVLIRNKFAFLDSNINFPVFDSAIIAYYTEMRSYVSLPELTRPIYKKEIKDIAKDVITSSVESLIDGVPVINTLIKKGIHFVIDKDDEKLLFDSRDYHSKLVVNGNFIAPSKIRERLVWFLAKDINHWLEKIKNDNLEFNVSSSILFDEYESLFKHTSSNNNETSLEIEEYIKNLILELDYSLITIFSRKKLDWGLEWKNILEERHYQLSGLNKKSARQLIQSAHNTLSEEVIEKILFNAREVEQSSKTYFPLLITLQLQNITNKKEENAKINTELLVLNGITFSQRKNELINRLLRDYKSSHRLMVERLCYCDEFDEDLFVSIAQEFRIDLSINDFERFCKNSVIRELESGGYTIMNVISDSLKINIKKEIDKNFESEMYHFLFNYHEKKAIVPEKLRFLHKNLKHLTFAAEYKQKLNPENYFHWLVKWNEYLRKGKFFIQGLSLWKNGLNSYLDLSLSDKNELYLYRNALACFYCALDKSEKVKENIYQNELDGKKQTSLDIANLIRYSPNQESIDYWFNKYKLPTKLPLSEKKHFYTRKILNSVLLNPYSNENREKYFQLFDQLKLKKNNLTLNALINHTDNLDKCLKILIEEDSIDVTDHTFSHLLEKTQSKEDDIKVLKLMNQMKYPLDTIHKNILLKTYSEEKTNELIVLTENKIPNEKTIITYTTCVSKADDFVQAKSQYNKMQMDKINPDDHFIQVLFSKCENIEHVVYVFETISNQAINVDIPWNNISKHIQSILDLKKILDITSITKKKPTTHFIKTILNQVIKNLKVIEGNDHYYIDKIEEILIHESLNTQFIFLETLIVNEKDYDKAYFYFKEVEKFPIKPTIAMINKMVILSKSFDESVVWLKYCENNDIDIKENLFNNAIFHIETINQAEHIIDLMLSRKFHVNYKLISKLVLKLKCSDLYSINDSEILSWLSGLDMYYNINREDVIIVSLIIEEKNNRITLKEELKEIKYNFTDECVQLLISYENNFRDSIDWLTEYKSQGNLITKDLLIKCATKIESFDDAEIIFTALQKNNIDIDINYYQTSTKALCENNSADKLMIWLNSKIQDITVVSETAIASYVRNDRINDAITFALLSPTSASACKLYREQYKLCEIRFKQYLASKNDALNASLALIFLYCENDCIEKANLILEDIKHKINDEDMIKLEKYKSTR